MTSYDVWWLVGIVVGGGALVAAICIHRLRGVPRERAFQLLLGVALYLLHGAIGITILIWCRPYLASTSAAAFGAFATLLGWLGLGLHLLFRLVPAMGDRPKPQWMVDVGLYDVVCLIVIGAGIAFATGLI